METKYKLKILKKADNPKDYYWKIITLDEILCYGLNVEFYLVLKKNKLITTINNIEIYENDCFLNKEENFYTYFYYQKNGLLYQSWTELNTKKQPIIPDCPASTDSSKNNNLFLDLDKLIFIGNIYDNEQYLLNQIKQLNN